jgi:polyphosphate kinase 2
MARDDNADGNDQAKGKKAAERQSGKKAGKSAGEKRDGQAMPQPCGTADGPYPYRKKLKRRSYEKTLRLLQIELLKVQQWAIADEQKIVILFEGRDAAGKGGTIKRFREHLNPRNARVVALAKPNDTERGQWYFQRYITQLPTAGEIVFFDRSWYNRAGVEPVMGFCTPAEYLRFIRQVAGVERALIDSGISLIKLWFDVSRDEQQQRIEARRTDPLKHWKLSPMDAQATELWEEYTRARDSMFFYSHIRESPWMVIRSDDKKRARINAMLAVLNALPYPDKDPAVVTPPDPLLVGLAPDMFPIEGRLVLNVVRT